MTPGFIRGPGLGGNIHGWPVSQVNAWRERFVRARASLAPVAGFGQFDLTGPNAQPDVMRAAIEAAKQSGHYYVEFRVTHPDGTLHWLAGKGLTIGMLYVDAANAGAAHLYEKLGFTIDHVDRAYVGDVAPRG